MWMKIHGGAGDGKEGRSLIQEGGLGEIKGLGMSSLHWRMICFATGFTCTAIRENAVHVV